MSSSKNPTKIIQPTSTLRTSSDLSQRLSLSGGTKDCIKHTLRADNKHQSGSHPCQNSVSDILDRGHPSELTSNNDRAGVCISMIFTIELWNKLLLNFNSMLSTLALDCDRNFRRWIFRRRNFCQRNFHRHEF